MASKLWWLIHKDLVIEYRSRQAWPAMCLLGIIVAVVFSFQMEASSARLGSMTGAFLWLAILFAGLIAIDRTCAAEQEDGCWESLKLFPVPSTWIYLAKFSVNFLALIVLEVILVPLFFVLSGLPLFQHSGALALIAALGSAGVAAVGTLVSALTHGLRQRSAILSLLALPLLLPVVLAGAEATRLLAAGNLGNEWFRCVQFLGAFALVFATLGSVLFGFLLED